MEQADRATLSTPVIERERLGPSETSVHMYLVTRCHTQECISQVIIMGATNGYDSVNGLISYPSIEAVL
jgi:hypothetical protein